MGSGMIVNSIKKSLVMPNSWNPIKICQTDGQEFNPYILPFFWTTFLRNERTESHQVQPGTTRVEKSRDTVTHENPMA
jgi:hypothetical protein